MERKRVTMHILPHSAAMELHLAGVDRSVILLWLGHESINTTQACLHTHLALKEAALTNVMAINGQREDVIGLQTGCWPSSTRYSGQSVQPEPIRT